MRVLKIVAEGLTTSFRYPHFIQSVHPTFPMPPPSTIYGHIASALGEWFDPEGVQFAYHFSYAAKERDIEHTIIVAPSSGQLKGSDIPKVLEGKVNPFYRELFFFPRLTLYINREEWLPAFQSPRYPVVLGRSQDLFSYTQVSVVTLAQAGEAYFEHTLLPYNANRQTGRGYAILMPRYLDNQRMRYPDFARYFVVEERVSSREFLWFGHKPEGLRYWIDPDSTEIKGERLGLSWLRFVGEDDETYLLAG